MPTQHWTIRICRRPSSISILFTATRNRARFRYGFDESVLNVDAEHQPNRFVGLRRAYSLALGGWAVGANIKLISTIRARDRGVAKPDYLESYEQGDLTRRNMKRVRQRVFPEPDPAPAQAQSKDEWVQTELPELEIMIDGFCDRNVDVYAYYTPSHVRQQSCDPGASEEVGGTRISARQTTQLQRPHPLFRFFLRQCDDARGRAEPGHGQPLLSPGRPSAPHRWPGDGGQHVRPAVSA